MSINLTQKERMILEDQKKHEEICIKKYNDYANQTNDPELKQMFKAFAQQEQTHLNTLTQMLNGQIPNMQQGQQQGQQNQQAQQGQQQNQQAQQQNQQQNQQTAQASNMSGGTPNQHDAYICNDLLMTEKYVSDTYDTAIFEFQDTNARDALNHIQKEEQQHGEGIYNYMKKKGMYQPKY